MLFASHTFKHQTIPLRIVTIYTLGCYINFILLTYIIIIQWLFICQFQELILHYIMRDQSLDS